MPYLVDSDVLVDLTRGSSGAADYLDSLGDAWSISMITCLELLAGARTQRETTALDLVYSVTGDLKAKRDIAYLADGYGEIVAEGEATAGPGGTLLFRLQSVNLDKEGRSESKSGVLLLDANLQDVARLDRFLEQTTFINHALVFQQGFTLGQSRTYDVLDGSPPSQIKQWKQDWPIDARDRKFGERGVAYMTCQQELRPNEYVSTGIVYAGARQRCTMSAEGGDGTTWQVRLRDGDTAQILGILADGSVAGQVNVKEARQGNWSSGKRIRPQSCYRGFPKIIAGRCRAQLRTCLGTLRSLHATAAATMAAG